MPKDGKTYMRCKRSGKKPDVKDVKSAGMQNAKSEQDKKKKHWLHEWASRQIEINGYMEIFSVIMMILSIGAGIYYGWTQSKGPWGMYLVLQGQKFAVYLRSFIFRAALPSFTSSDISPS
jgi:hypothetical protein